MLPLLAESRTLLPGPNGLGLVGAREDPRDHPAVRCREVDVPGGDGGDLDAALLREVDQLQQIGRMQGWLGLWGIGVFFLAIIGWFAVLFTLSSQLNELGFMGFLGRKLASALGGLASPTAGFSLVVAYVLLHYLFGDAPYLRPGGYTGSIPRGGNLGPNGLTYDGAGHVLTAVTRPRAIRGW